MQSETAYFVPGAATWRTRRNIHIVLWFSPMAPLCENMTSSTKSEVHNVLHSRQRRAEPCPQLGNICKTFVKFWLVGFQIFKRTKRKTDTNMVIAIPGTPTGSEVECKDDFKTTLVNYDFWILQELIRRWDSERKLFTTISHTYFKIPKKNPLRLTN